MSKNQVYFDESALEVVQEVYDIGGGTVVVEELPEVGEEHTIYELHQNVEPAYNWVARVTNEIANIEPSRNILIFDTYEQMTNIIEDSNIFAYSTYYYIYLRNEDKLYDVVLDTRSGQLECRECNKISNYIFDIDGSEYIYVLKSYEEWDETTDKYYCTLYDGTKVELGYFDNINHNAFILYQAIFECMELFMNFASIIPSVTQLPTAEEAVENYLDELITNDGIIAVEIDEVVKRSSPSSNNYYFDTELQNFYTNDEVPVVYTGPLEWKDISSTIYTEIPYNEPIELDSWCFKPTQAGEKVSYWIYTNGEWMNIDEIPDPNLIKIGITCTNGNWDVMTLPLDTITVTYDDVDYNVTQYAETSVPTEQGATVTYYGYIEVPMPTQDNLTHSFKVSTTGMAANWAYSTLISDGDALNSDHVRRGKGILAIKIYYNNLS